jgi:hypothetical protein
MKTLRFAAAARIDNEIRVFNVYGPYPTVSKHDEVLGTFPDTRKGEIAAGNLVADINSRGFERGTFDVR